MNDGVVVHMDYIKENTKENYWDTTGHIYHKKHISNAEIVDKYLQENFDLSLDGLKEFIEKYELERTI